MLTSSPGKRRRTSATRRAIALALAVAVLGPASLAEASTPRNATTKPAKAVPSVIIDTDLSRWWDDATVIGLANVLQNRGKIRILGIVSDVPNTAAVAAIDAINTAYGNGKIPVGAVDGSDADTFQHGYTDVLVSRLAHSVKSSNDVPEAVSLYRRLLAKQPDHSVTIVSIGGYTNLAGLLRSKRGQGTSLDGRKLVATKVKRLVIEDGLFPNEGVPAFTNQKIDLAAATEVLSGAGWPTPAAWVDGATGGNTRVGGTLCTAAPADNPMRIVYETLFACGPPDDGDWDAPTLLYAINGAASVFSELGQGGAAVINAQGGLSWQTVSDRVGDVYVHVLDQQTLNNQIDELLVAH
jgi:pyrimidine-specific ribonucleoside hydrolase